MEREIKFRGKAKDDGTWVHGDLTTGDTIHTSPSWHEDGEGEWWGRECHEETIGQYIGYDINETIEIYGAGKLYDEVVESEKLTIPDVSNRRELLIKFCDALFEQSGIQITNVQIDFLMRKFNL